MACTSYGKKIEDIFDAMIRLSDEVLPENRKGVNDYICGVWTEVCIFTRSIEWEEGTDEFMAKFQSHIDAEEEKLRENLEDIKYDIDSYESARLVSGHGQIETVRSPLLRAHTWLSPKQTLFPMLYLLLSRDLQKISLARKYVLSEFEFPDAMDTITWITASARYRVSDLICEKVVFLPLILA